MSKLSSLYRQLEIINIAKKGPFTQKELEDHLREISDRTNLDLNRKPRTLTRDLKEIRELFGVAIEYDFNLAAFQIDKYESSETHTELLEAFETIQAFGRATRLEGKVFPEKKVPRGTEHLKPLLEAIENQQIVHLVYQKFYEKETEKRAIRPIALKEYLYRWYVLAWNENDELRFFGLDRIHSLEVLPGNKKFPKSPNLEDRFLQTIGIINVPEEPVETVFLTFTKFKGKYILSMPLHPTQQVMEENEDTIQISLRLKLNYELVSIILSHGNEVRVDYPQRLKDMIDAKVKDILNGNLKS